jgi:hypothetical protein
MQTEVKFLGSIMSRNGMFVNPDSIDAVKKKVAGLLQRPNGSFVYW